MGRGAGGGEEMRGDSIQMEAPVEAIGERAQIACAVLGESAMACISL